MYKLLFFIFFLLFLWYYLLSGIGFDSREAPAVYIEQPPRQTKIDDARPFYFDEFLITPLAEFDIQARVLSRENYYLGRESDLAPIDLALGWQKMSDPVNLAYLDITQSGRWYRYRWEDTRALPLSPKEISTQSANMHMIPANETVADALDNVREGETIRIQGKLVRVDASDGWRWVSSMSRNDTGGGACELIYVERLTKHSEYF